jgi:crotonobetainyl-CoA:carnitine CoA-transferase CaiB-like acyl-CoA transferase
VVRLVGRADLASEPWFATGAGRVAHVDEIDGAVAAWVAARDGDEVLAAFEAAQAAAAPVYDASDIVTDPQIRARHTVTTVDDPDLGPIAMQNVLFRLSTTPGAIRWPGRAPGADTDTVLARLGFTPAEIAGLRAEGAV